MVADNNRFSSFPTRGPWAAIFALLTFCRKIPQLFNVPGAAHLPLFPRFSHHGSSPSVSVHRFHAAVSSQFCSLLSELVPQVTGDEPIRVLDIIFQISRPFALTRPIVTGPRRKGLIKERMGVLNREAVKVASRGSAACDTLSRRPGVSAAFPMCTPDCPPDDDKSHYRLSLVKRRRSTYRRHNLGHGIESGVGFGIESNFCAPKVFFLVARGALLAVERVVFPRGLNGTIESAPRDVTVTHRRGQSPALCKTRGLPGPCFFQVVCVASRLHIDTLCR